MTFPYFIFGSVENQKAWEALVEEMTELLGPINQDWEGSVVSLFQNTQDPKYVPFLVYTIYLSEQAACILRLTKSKPIYKIDDHI